MLDMYFFGQIKRKCSLGSNVKSKVVSRNSINQVVIQADASEL